MARHRRKETKKKKGSNPDRMIPVWKGKKQNKKKKEEGANSEAPCQLTSKTKKTEKRGRNQVKPHLNEGEKPKQQAQEPIVASD